MISKDAKQNLIKKFQIDSNDTGSTPVQIALISERIENLTRHISSNKKDYSTKLGLLKLVSQRKKLLQYLQTIDQNMYREVVDALGLRK
jgi:small subunit ribosomal protein S15